MAYVGGPTSTLPGARLRFPEGTTCDEHPDRIAVARIQGETDSWGYEAIDACQECMDRIDNHKKDAIYTCDWCGTLGELLPTRDPDEGLTGPVYHVCHACLVKQSERSVDEIVDDYCGPEDTDFGDDDE